MAPPQFGDLTKSIDDVWGRAGFGEDKKVKMSFKTPKVHGGAITVSEEIKGVTDFSKGFTSKLSAKWKSPCGIAITKFDNDLKKGTVLETSYDKLGVDGLTLNCNMNLSHGDKGSVSFPFEVTYENDLVAASVASSTSFKEVTAGVSLSSDGLLVGTQLQYKGCDLKDYPITLKFVASEYEAALQATKNLTVFGLLAKYKASPDLTLASYVTVPDYPTKANFCGVYNLGDEYKTKVAGQFSYEKGKKEKSVECSVVSKPLAGVESGFSLMLPIANLGAFKYGFSFTLG
jgi:hypothetical protein